MPWIKPVKQTEIKKMKVYDQLEPPVSVFHRLMAHTPDLLTNFTPLQQAVKQVGVGEVLREMIITYVSARNWCDYCTKSHKELLVKLTDEDTADNLVADNLEQFDTKVKAVLTYARKLTVNRNELRLKDIENLMKEGFSEQDIVEINHLIAYTSYTNQLSIGLGL
ncbi:carboxymuconolactone decarboxylase family protein [Alteribacter keqinensis]|uniref:Carboxymuconolactone decarboxylase-like domain-containing protein n=1 Tax=Alteribacter keqinensis TaxID=2483800 RepID=A0A3M7TT17_9BACI|nr:carboxymuconolactone decarboxylase family protein [Alteribacter keqinensis]RNA68657.1 hypothetical protein EBO34_01430 [Alteribacter keqinensis]